MHKQAKVLEEKSNWQTIMLVIGIILIGSNLRAPLTAVGSLVPFIRDDLQISNALAGTITTLPLLAFALLSPFAPKLAKRFGVEKTIFFSLIFLTIGIIIRSLVGVGFLFSGTILIGLAIAIGNVLLPGFIKLNFPLGIGLMTGIYAVFMNLFGALASGISVPLTNWKNIGWQGALGFWSILAVLAILLWIPQLFNKKLPKDDTVQIIDQPKSIWKSGLAWKITIFMGSQSLLFYTLMTWLPEILHLKGYSSSAAGWMLSLLQFALIPITFIIPVIAGKVKNQQFLSTLTAILFLIGILGLMNGGNIIITLSVILIGIAGGSAFGLAMMFFTLRTKDSKQAAELSGMAQSFGYLFASIGPVLFGGLHDLTQSWTIPLIMLMGVAVVIFIVGLGAGKSEYI